MNIFFKEWKLYRNFIMGWTVAIGALIFLGMAFYPILMEGNTLRQLTAFFENPFMKNIMAAFGASLDVLTNPLGFYVTRNAVFVILLGSFFSILLAGKILAREEHEKTAEFLLAKPVTRFQVVLSKLAAFFTSLMMMNIAILIIGFLSLEIYKGDQDYRLASFIVHWVYSFLLMLSIGAVGLFLSVLVRRGRPVTNLSIGIVVGGYIIDVLSRMTESAEKIGYLSPFKFIDSRVLLPHYGLVWWRVIYFLAIFFVFVVLTFIIYRRKDILV